MRGCQKRIVYLKNTGSAVFEEAYFVIKEKNKKGAIENAELEEKDLVEEANRIIDENTKFQYKKRGLRISKKSLLIFLVGFLTSAALFCFVVLLLNI